MLDLNQIKKKLAKPYTNVSMTKYMSIRYDESWWSNGFVIFFEPLPEKLAKSCGVPDTPAEKLSSIALLFQSWISDATVQVWPVELCGPKFGCADPLIKFTDGTDSAFWFDARYVTAIAKRKPTAFYISSVVKYLVAFRDGEVVAILAPRHWKDGSPYDWRLANYEIPASQNALM